MPRRLKILLSAEAHEFINLQTKKAKAKIYNNIDKIEAGIVNNELFKKLEGTSLWELRTEYEGIAYRILAFWDKRHNALVIATHGFIKKR